MHLFLIRHGECVGQADPNQSANPDTCLSERGRQQAALIAQRLRPEGLTHLLSSPLVRALETAAIIRDYTGHSQIDVWVELRESATDRHRGYGRAALLRRFPAARLPDCIGEDGWEHGGEDYAAVCARAEALIARLASSFDAEDRIGLITHRGLANHLVQALLGTDPAEPVWFELINTGLTHLRIVPDPAAERPNWPLYPPVRVEVLALNDAGHLRELERHAG